MKKFCLNILLSLFSFAAIAQSIEHDYYESSDTLALILSKKDCNRFVKQSIKKAKWLTLKLQKTNNQYLHLFMKEEDALLHSLCRIPSLPTLPESFELQTDHDTNLLNTEASAYSMNNANTFKDSTNNIEVPGKITLPRKENIVAVPGHKDFSGEPRAEAMMLDAWYSFNRFENMSGRNADESPHQYFAEFDSLTVAVDYLKNQDTNMKCECQGLNELKHANAHLKRELKRTELIRQYINERQTFLANTLKESEVGKSGMIPMNKSGRYFNAQVTEYQSIFNDRTSLEGYVFQLLRSLPDFGQMMNSNGQLAIPNASNGVTRTAGEKLSLADLMAKAPPETKKMLADINPVNKKTESTEIVSELEESKSKADDAISNLKEESQLHTGTIDTLSTSRDNLKINAKRNEENSKATKLNPLKTKRFIDRLDHGFNIQLDPHTTFLPSAASATGTMSFQYYQNGHIGLGACYIQPLPKNILASENRMQVPTSSGYGWKLFLDQRVSSGLFIQGSYERNFRPYLSNVNGIESAIHSSVMQSALLGLKMEYRTKSKRARPTLEIMYDFLHTKTDQPAIVIRTGINYKSRHALK